MTSLPLPVPFLRPALLPPQPSFHEAQKNVQDLLISEVGYSLPPLVRQFQERVLASVRELVITTGNGLPRLYVLSVAGRNPSVKVGLSEDPAGRIRRHLTTMNRYGHALVAAHVTDPLPDRVCAKRAEDNAHRWMRRAYQPITREEFANGDFGIGVACADQAVRVQLGDGAS